ANPTSYSGQCSPATHNARSARSGWTSTAVPTYGFSALTCRIMPARSHQRATRAVTVASPNCHQHLVDRPWGQGDDRTVRSRQAWAGVAGILAGGAGLAVSLLLSGLFGQRLSPLSAMSETVAALTPGAVVEAVISAVG